jgi:hypothetical protein
MVRKLMALLLLLGILANLHGCVIYDPGYYPTGRVYYYDPYPYYYGPYLYSPFFFGGHHSRGDFGHRFDGHGGHRR